jgi:protein-disulfide isomerase
MRSPLDPFAAGARPAAQETSMKNRSLFLLASLAALTSLGSAACSHGVTVGADPTPTAAAQEALAPSGGGPAAARAFATYKVPVDGLPSIGRADAPVTIVEFTDYQCPYCQHAERTITQVRAKYGDAVRVVVAEMPLPFHDRARPAAVAALAADSEGKFEAMHGHLFGLSGALSDAAITGAAQEAGFDLARFDVSRAAAPLATAEQLAKRLGVQGTPAFFIDGRRVAGAQPFETFVDVIDERLTAAKSLLASGVRPRDVYAQITAAGADHVVDEGKDDKEPGSGCEDAPGCGGDSDKGAAAPAVSDKIETVSTDGAPSRGPARASITIVSFGDYECPFTARGEEILHAVDAAHPHDVRFVFKNLALPMHAHARLTAIAALAAEAQGHFWHFHDRVFSRGATALDREGLTKIATEVGLDIARFSRDLDDPALAARVARDQADADALNVKGTPTFFVNGRRIVGAQPEAAFEAAIAKASAR